MVVQGKMLRILYMSSNTHAHTHMHTDTVLHVCDKKGCLCVLCVCTAEHCIFWQSLLVTARVGVSHNTSLYSEGVLHFW